MQKKESEIKEPQEIQEQPGTLIKGTEFTLMENRVKVHQIDLPRLTLQLTHKKRQFNPELRGQRLTFGGHDFLVKSANGRRLYLLLVEIKEKKVIAKDVYACSACGNDHDEMVEYYSMPQHARPPGMIGNNTLANLRGWN